jgi:hypothetical protein
MSRKSTAVKMLMGSVRRRTVTTLLLAVAVVAAIAMGAARSTPVAETGVLAVTDDCKQALTYPDRSAADRVWLDQCVHALRTPAPTTGTGFYQVVGKQMQDPDGEQFSVRGAEQVFWNASWLPTSIVTEYGKTGGNALRILPYYLKPTPTGEPPSTLAQIEDMIRRGINAHMAVGIGIDGGSDPSVYLRPEIKALLFKYQKYLIIHAKGESYEASDNDWVNNSNTVIATMREAGYKCPLFIVSREGGRNLPTLLARAQEVFDRDPLKNVVFVWQAYWGTDNYYQNKYGMTLTQAMQRAADQVVRIQVGITLHSDPQTGSSATIPYSQLMAQATQLQLGWMWWDWRMGVDNLTTDGRFGSWTTLGLDVAVNNTNSIIKTAKRTRFMLNQVAPPL